MAIEQKSVRLTAQEVDEAGLLGISVEEFARLKVASRAIPAPKGIRTCYYVGSSHDDVKFAIADRDGRVIIYFDKAVHWIEAPSSQMVDIACSLLHRAGVKFTIHEE